MNFGPNNRALFGDGPTFHHRSPDYSQLITDLESLFRERFNVPKSSSVLFLTGSGTLANEAVAFSLREPVYVQGEQFEFGYRLSRLCAAHSSLDQSLLKGRQAWVAYETSCSKLNHFEHKSMAFNFVDAVSSFPYYDPDPSWDIWTTVSSKQLGALPVVSIVVVSAAGWDSLLHASDAYSYLNLARYRDFQYQKQQSPHTPSIALLDDLRSSLAMFDTSQLRQRCDHAREVLAHALPAEAIIGEGPVLTVKEEFISPEIAAKYGLYRGKAAWQIFLWAGTPTEVESLAKELA